MGAVFIMKAEKQKLLIKCKSLQIDTCDIPYPALLLTTEVD